MSLDDLSTLYRKELRNETTKWHYHNNENLRKSVMKTSKKVRKNYVSNYAFCVSKKNDMDLINYLDGIKATGTGELTHYIVRVLRKDMKEHEDKRSKIQSKQEVG